MCSSTVERSVRPIALHRKDALFAGSEQNTGRTSLRSSRPPSSMMSNR
ncbi:hypothetical protein [Rhizobium sp. BK456]|nr:hypothetical protein [Rhizobium sp. BK456]